MSRAGSLGRTGVHPLERKCSDPRCLGGIEHVHFDFGPPISKALLGDIEPEAQRRKALPIYSGVLKYFPDALLEVARVSKVGNDQHNPGQPLHWAREKSTDQLDAAVRHLVDHANGKIRDSDDTFHLAKAAWRILAELQLLLEK